MKKERLYNTLNCRMSDEDRDIDIESDEDDDELNGSNASTQFMSPAERRAHHNALERKRRDHIKDSFHSLRDSVPALQGEKVSRAQILKKAADYIQFMRRKNVAHQHDIEDLRKQNSILEQQIKALEKAKSTGQFASAAHMNSKGSKLGTFDGDLESDESSNEEEAVHGRRKKLKLSVD